MDKLGNKVAVVTGGSAGIGLGAAKRFAAEGAQVFINGRRPSEMDKAVAEIGRNIIAVPGDTSKLSDIDLLYKTIKEQPGAKKEKKFPWRERNPPILLLTTA